MKQVVDGKTYRDGYPQEEGWYHCLVDGEPMNLRNYWCCVGRRHEWVHPDGSYEYGNVLYGDKYG